MIRACCSTAVRFWKQPRCVSKPKSIKNSDKENWYWKPDQILSLVYLFGEIFPDLNAYVADFKVYFI